jgi:hypothetical protein
MKKNNIQILINIVVYYFIPYIKKTSPAITAELALCLILI